MEPDDLKKEKGITKLEDTICYLVAPSGKA